VNVLRHEIMPCQDSNYGRPLHLTRREILIRRPEKVFQTKEGKHKMNYGHNFKGITQWIAVSLKLYLFELTCN
jgi:hypothetical protein